MTGWAPLTDKDFKEVSGQNRHVGSLDGVTTVEKEKFPKNFWPDVSMHERTSVYASFCACSCVFVCVRVCGPKGDVGTNESTGAAVGVCLL